MDTQDNELKTHTTNTVDPAEDTNTKEQETAPEEVVITEEDNSKEITPENVSWEEKFQKQSSNAQRTITQANESLYTVHRKLAETDGNHLLDLANGDDKDVKIAKRLSEEVFKLPLDQVLESLKPEVETVEAMEVRLRSEIERKVTRETSYGMFLKTNNLLNENSSEFNQNIRTSFDDKVKRLTGIGIVTLDEQEEILNDSLYLAMKGQNNSERTQEQIASAGSGGGGMINTAKPLNKDVKAVEDTMATFGVTLSPEAKKLLAQGKI